MTLAEILESSCSEIERYVSSAAFTPAVALLLDVCKSQCPDMLPPAISISRRYHALKRPGKVQPQATETINDVEADLLGLLRRLRQGVSASPPPQSPPLPESPPPSASPPPPQILSERHLDLAEPSPPATPVEQDPPQPRVTPQQEERVETPPQSSPRQKRGRLWTGRAKKVVAPQPEPTGALTTSIISCSQISKAFSSSGFHLDSLSVELNRGEIAALVGTNGSGKTTFLRLLLGEIAPDMGTIRYFLSGQEDRNWWDIKRQIGYVSQQSKRWPGYLRPFLLYTSAMHSADGRANVEEVDWHLHRYGLIEYADVGWNELSGGYRTRTELVRALVANPKMLILDEPLAYLDVITQDLFLTDLRSIRSTVGRGIPILITSQHIAEIEGIADQIIVLEDGKCRFSGLVSDLRRDADGFYFEISPGFKSDVLTRSLGALGLEHIDETSNGNILFFNKRGDESEIFAAISAQLKGQLMAVRNITGSAKRMFRDRRDEF